MRINYYGFRTSVCSKCEKHSGQVATFGKCVASETNIHRCASERISPTLDKIFEEEFPEGDKP